MAAGQVGQGGGAHCRAARVVPILPGLAGEGAVRDLQTGVVHRAVAAVQAERGCIYCSGML